MNNLGKKLGVPVLGAAAIILSGCNFLTGLERDLDVVLYAKGEVFDTCTVNIFNNYYVKEDVKVTEPGYIFWGWSPKEDYIPEVDDASLLIKNKKVIRYNDVAQWKLPDSNKLDLYAVIAPRPVYDLVVGWYDKVATSGLDQTIMNKFSTGLKTYLTSEGKDVATMKIDVRAYDGDVATVGSKVNADTDVDILLGMGNNITSTGGIETKGRIDGVTMGAKTGRNIALLSDKELASLVFEWCKTAEAQALLK